MVPQKQIDEFVSRLRDVADNNLQSVILYGSAVAGEFHPDFSNVNLLCVLRETSFDKLAQLAPAVEPWNRQKRHAPLLLTQQEIERSADVFSIEWLDMKQRHRVLFGDDVLSGLEIPMHLHRAQVEYELREKTILLRQRLLSVTNDEEPLWDLMLGSLPAFATLFRHALIALGEPSPHSSRETIRTLKSRLVFDSSSFERLFDIRERLAETKHFNVKEVFTHYLNAIQQVTAAVDTMLDSPRPQSL